MSSPTALRALASQLEQAGWTSVAVTKRGTLLSISGRDPSGRPHAASCGYRAAAAVINDLITLTAPQEEEA